MDQQKITGRALVLLGLMLLVFSCKKLDKDNPITFNIKAHIPYSGEPISGVKYTIREYYTKKQLILGEKEYTDFVLEGVTGANGLAEISFLPKKNMKYHYDIQFDYSNMQFQAFTGSYSMISAPTYNIITRNDQQNFDIRVLPKMDINYKLENVSCSGSADSMRIILKNSDEFSAFDFNYETWSPYGLGCYLSSNQIQGLAGRYVYKIQIIRNGILTQYIDTILIAPGVNNNLFIEY